MNIKERVLEALELNRGSFVSGEALSQKLGVSRQYIWKAVKALSAEGYEITSFTNRGYCLSGKCDKLSSAVIASLTGAVVYCFDSVASTNRTARELYPSSGECIVAAEKQTDGVKKDGSRFPSPKASGVYMTAAIALDIPVGKLQDFRKLCAAAVQGAIARACGSMPEITGVDDIYLNGKKVCGILIECLVNSATMRAECAYIGVGVYTGESAEIAALGAIESDETRNALIADIYNSIKRECF